MRILVASLLLSLLQVHLTSGGGGKDKEHDLIKIHVPEIIKSEHHTHYVFIHKHHKPKPKPKKHGHHFMKHWFVTSHKSSGHGHGGHGGHGGGHGGHGGGHGHGMKKEHGKKEHGMKKEHGKKEHKGHGHKKPHGMKKPHEMKHHDYEYDGPSYEVTEQYYDEPTGFGQNDYGFPTGQGGATAEEEQPYFAYPPAQEPLQYGGLSSYDISPYPEQPKTDEYGQAQQEEQFVPQDYSYQQGGFVDFGEEENIPGYSHHHKHFLNEINHGVHSSNLRDKITKFSLSNDEEANSDQYGTHFDKHKSKY